MQDGEDVEFATFARGEGHYYGGGVAGGRGVGEREWEQVGAGRLRTFLRGLGAEVELMCVLCEDQCASLYDLRLQMCM